MIEEEEEKSVSTEQQESDAFSYSDTSMCQPTFDERKVNEEEIETLLNLDIEKKPKVFEYSKP